METWRSMRTGGEWVLIGCRFFLLTHSHYQYVTIQYNWCSINTVECCFLCIQKMIQKTSFILNNWCRAVLDRQLLLVKRLLHFEVGLWFPKSEAHTLFRRKKIILNKLFFTFNATTHSWNWHCKPVLDTVTKSILTCLHAWQLTKGNLHCHWHPQCSLTQTLKPTAEQKCTVIISVWFQKTSRLFHHICLF